MVAAFSQIFSFVFKLFEEFVVVVFPSFSWSANRSVGPVFWAEFWVPFRSFDQPSLFLWCCLLFSSPVSISFFFESTSNIVLSRFPSFPQLQWCSFSCIGPIPLLRFSQRQFLHHCQSWVTRHCLDHYEMYRFFLSSLSSLVQLESMSFMSSLFLASRLWHSFMHFGGCPCSQCVKYRRSYCCVEQSESVLEPWYDFWFRSVLDAGM